MKVVNHIVEVDKEVGEYLVLHPDGNIVLKLSQKEAQKEVDRFTKRLVGPDDIVISKINWRIK